MTKRANFLVGWRRLLNGYRRSFHGVAVTPFRCVISARHKTCLRGQLLYLFYAVYATLFSRNPRAHRCSRTSGRTHTHTFRRNRLRFSIHFGHACKCYEIQAIGLFTIQDLEAAEPTKDPSLGRLRITKWY
jgi:hypothetical protein